MTDRTQAPEEAYRPYAGIGSRETPKTICDMMQQIAEGLGRQGYTCRTGGADGADHAFLKGAKEAFYRKGPSSELFLPWSNFNGNHSTFSVPPVAAYAVARKYHPGFDKLTPSVQKLMARNAQQIQGRDLASNSKFVICWTPDGCINGETRTKATGGTGQAIAHASDLGIPVFNLARPEHYAQFEAYLKSQNLKWSMSFEEAHADRTPAPPSAASLARQEKLKLAGKFRQPPAK
jgi:hypothetical protein